MILFSVILFIIILSSVSIILHIIDSKRVLNLLDENEYKKIYNFDYDSVEIVRKRRPIMVGTGPRSLYQKANLEKEYPIPLMPMIEDIIEVYGYEKNKKYLIYRSEWSKNDIEKIKTIINSYNNRKEL
jgi:hypothetical protein